MLTVESPAPRTVPGTERGLINILKFIPKFVLFFDPLLALAHPALLCAQKGGFRTLGELSVSTGKGVAKVEMNCTDDLKTHVSMQDQPLLQWYLVPSEFELGDRQDTWCVSAGEELTLELGCKAPRPGGSEVIQPAQLLAVPSIVHPAGYTTSLALQMRFLVWKMRMIMILSPSQVVART